MVKDKKVQTQAKLLILKPILIDKQIKLFKNEEQVDFTDQVIDDLKHF